MREIDRYLASLYIKSLRLAVVRETGARNAFVAMTGSELSMPAVDDPLRQDVMLEICNL